MSFFTNLFRPSATRPTQERNMEFLIESLENREMLTGTDSGDDYPEDGDENEPPAEVSE